ncbi:MAG: gliding motility-associated C-terminal domain-containing protein [Lewinellaceae bacterium]|nr:gliding motility-associated C-terminal domain-containing protein [Lewinellaceae bacterium]
MNIRYTFSIILTLAHIILLNAQLDTIHWLPPMHARDEWGPQYLYLSTPEKTPFLVTIRDGAGNILDTLTISNTQPQRYGGLGNSNDSETMVPYTSLHQPLKGKGLVIDGPKKFYAYYRVHSNSRFHAGDLTCKGRSALGTVFRIGHLLQAVDNNGRRSNFIGVMATEDSTEIVLSDFDPQTDFQIALMSTSVMGPITMTLQKGESVVFSQYIIGSANTQPPNGLIGALLKSSKPIAVNCGSWVGAPVMFQAHDIGIDQITPLDKVGTDYILCKGNGSSILERPIIVAHTPGTAVWLNGTNNPVAVLDAGEYLAVTTDAYTAAGNLYIRSSEPVFVYQMIGGTSDGDDAMRTAGLIFVPPISCAIPNAVDNIYQPNLIGDMRFEGGLMVVAMKDSMVTVRIDGAVTPMGPPADVPGMPDFVTYRNLNLFDFSKTPATVSVEAEGAIQVAMFGRNEPASFAAFYSGFSKIAAADIQLSLIGDGVCPDTLIANGHFDGVQWMYEDSILQYGPDTFFIAYAPGRYVATGYLGVCRQTDFASDTVVATFESPQFPYMLEEPSCYGYSDGHIAFGTPYGGKPPYQYSIDDGKLYSAKPLYEGLPSGDYKLVVRDVTGCYNKPLTLHIGQPDSFTVELVLRLLPDPLKPGGKVILEGIPGRPVIASDWEPPRDPACPDCLDYTFYPDFDTQVTLTVYDSAGCPAVTSRLVAVEPNVYVPNVFMPASILGNDRFTLFSRDPLPIHYLAVFDRWGDMVFENRNFFTNQPESGWDGNARGKAALPGVYVFTAEVEVVPGKVLKLAGDVLLVR